MLMSIHMFTHCAHAYAHVDMHVYTHVYTLVHTHVYTHCQVVSAAPGPAMPMQQVPQLP